MFNKSCYEKDIFELLSNSNILSDLILRDKMNEREIDVNTPVDLVHMISSAINFIDEAVGILDLEGNYVFVNECFSDLFGGEKTYKNINDIVAAPFNWNEIRFYLEESNRWRGDLLKKVKTNETKLYKISLDLIRNEDELPVAVIEKAKSIQKDKNELQQIIKLANVGKLTAGVVHELKNQLHIMMGYTELVLRDDKKLNPETKIKLRKILNCAKTSSDLVGNFLSFAKKRKLEKINVDLNLLIENTIELKKFDLRVKNISLKTMLDKKVPPALVEPTKIQQVLLNLLNNAEEALEKNGAIEIVSKYKSGTISVEIIDNGKGIDSRIKDDLFSPFTTSKQGSKGTGLGLSISKDIIEECGGRLYLDESYIEGAKFVFTLPPSKRK